MEGITRKLAENPREKANIFSILTFWWTKDLFLTGYRKILELEDLFRPLRIDQSNALGDRLEIQWHKQLSKPGRPSLLKAICRTFWKEYTILGIFSILNDVIVRLSQPLLLGKLLEYFRANSTMSHQEALYYAGGIVISNAISAVVLNQFFIGVLQNGMKVRVAVCSIIYRKALKLSQTALGETAPGKVVNLLSNDVNRFDIVSMFLHAMWTSPLMALIVGYLLWREAGWAGLIGMAFVFTVVPIQSYTGKLSSRFRLQTALRTDERVRFMDEIISGLQVIKMYAWEKPFGNLISTARRMELKIVRKNAYVRALFMTFMLFTTRMAIFTTMLSIVLLYGSGELQATKVFVISAYFNIVSMTMSQMFVRGVAEIAEALVAFRRLRKFLEYDEKNEKEKHYLKLGMNGDVYEKEKLLESDSDLPVDLAISMKSLTARWVPLSDKNEVEKVNPKKISPISNGIPKENFDWKLPTLDNINCDLKKGKLIGIVGSVGAGKSSFLQAILRELPLESGLISINGTIAYACQEPWIFAATVQQNILFGEEMDMKRYDAVVHACALVRDFEQLENGDLTVIGERGTSLSGGQKARINLARAVYRKADIFLLDDPLSAVDAHVGRHLYNECIGPKGRLATLNATRILVTHQVHFLKDADWVIILQDGKIEMQGTPSELSRNADEFAKLLEIDEKQVETKLIKSRSRTNSKSSVKSYRSGDVTLAEEEDNTIDDSEFGEEDDIEKTKTIQEPQKLEDSSRGKVSGSVFVKYFRSGTNLFSAFLILLLFILTQCLASSADYWVSFWTSQEERRHLNATERELSILNSTFEEHINESSKIFNGTSLTDFDFKQDQSDTSTDDGLLSTEMCIYIHGSLVAGIFIVGITRSISFYNCCVRASQNLHNLMFKGIVSTTMRFFDTNPSGRILNRFSKDTGAADEILPKAVLDSSQIILNMFGAVIVTSIVNPMFLIPIAILGVFFMFIRKVYLKTAKNIKRLEGVTRSPVFTHISATLTGLSTIRAFNAQKMLTVEFDNHQDLHTSCWYMFLATSSAFGFSLDVICLIFVFIVTFSFLFFDQGFLGDRVGLAITQSMALTGMLQWGIRQSAEVANQLMSVERMLEYCGLPSEKQPAKPHDVLDKWPSNGKIEFRDVVYRYFDGAEPVLRNLHFTVVPCEKIGIVGRTGAGKSSLIGAIFRLAKIEGDIYIDDVNTETISLHDLRSHVSIIPQDPVLFSGTLRRNLDPFEEYIDTEVWHALDSVQLKEIASGPLGLQTAVMAGGSNFSVGQRQLLCLARAILRNNKILILDEATANVDPHTDSLIQETIRSRFLNCTVLTVAHRLHTIIDSDRVIVMDGGQAIEFATPHELLQMRTGIFRNMVYSLGSQEYEKLCKVAKDKFDSMHKLL